MSTEFEILDYMTVANEYYMCPVCFKLYHIENPLSHSARKNTTCTISEVTKEGEVNNNIKVDTENSALTVELSIPAPCELNESWCHTNLIPIDRGIMYHVQSWNRLGFKTEFSCAGHVYNDGTVSVPYMMFNQCIHRTIDVTDLLVPMLDDSATMHGKYGLRVSSIISGCNDGQYRIEPYNLKVDGQTMIENFNTGLGLLIDDMTKVLEEHGTIKIIWED